MQYKNALARKLADIELSVFRVFAGFDAITDHIARPIKMASPDGYVYYDEIAEFGQAIVSRKALSGVVSLKRQVVKAGGNMTNYACALGNLNVAVDCFGPFGLPEVEEVFLKMPPSCKLHSIGKAGMCTALEFSDGKLMLVDNTDNDDLTWDSIRNANKQEELEESCAQSDLIALANWSEIKNATKIWRGMLDLIVLHGGKQKAVCIDITDFSYRSAEDVKELAELLQLYCRQTRCVLTLNRNEALLLYGMLCPEYTECGAVWQVGEFLYKCFAPHMLIIHNAQGAFAWTEKGLTAVGSYYTANSKICTGAGDSFNAGLSIGVLCGFETEESLQLANAVSGYYVRKGCCPGIKELGEFIEVNKMGALDIDQQM